MSDLMNSSSVHLLLIVIHVNYFSVWKGEDRSMERVNFLQLLCLIYIYACVCVCVCIQAIFLHLVIQVDMVTFLPDREVENVGEFSLPAWTVWLRDDFKQFCLNAVLKVSVEESLEVQITQGLFKKTSEIVTVIWCCSVRLIGMRNCLLLVLL